MSAKAALPAPDRTLYISDLDGTLLQSNAALSAFAIAALRELIAAGMMFSIATARSAASTRTILAPLPLSLPVILMNGAQIFDPAGDRYLQVEYIPPAALHDLLDLLDTHSVSGFLYGLNGQRQTTYYEARTSASQRAFMAARVRKYNKPFVQVPSFRQITAQGICYVSLAGPYARLAPLRDALQMQTALGHSFYEDVHANGDWLMEVHSHQASKGQAVQRLRAQHAFERVVGFGDNLNDLSLFAVCDETYAVANAHPDLLAAANERVGSNQADGVVHKLLSLWHTRGENT